jgi:sigma-B regulation protein RsbU (phosphoserine phosphatase)
VQEENIALSLMNQEVEIAGKFQNQLFPQSMPNELFFRIAAKYLPSSTISGDFYDISLDSEGNHIILIADVSGHGYSAGLIASMVKIAFLETCLAPVDGVEQKNRMNRMLYKNIQNNFVTTATLRLIETEKKIEYICCGHMPLLILEKDTNEIQEIRPRGMPLGISEVLNCSKAELPMISGHRFFLYTDGLIEEENSRGEMFGNENLKFLLKKHSSMNVEQFTEHVKETLIKWKKDERFEDDITFVVIDIN